MISSMNSNKRALFFLIIITVIFFLPLITGHIIYEGDLFDEYIPVKYFQVQSMEKLNFPACSEGIGGGFPIYQDIQSGLYYPLNILLLLPINIFLIIQFMIMLDIIILGIGCFLLMKRITGNELKSYILAVIVMFSGTVISRLGHLSILNSIAFIPFYFIFFRNILKKDSGKWYLILSALFAFIVLSGGHPQVFFLLIICSIIYGIGRISIKTTIQLSLLTTLFSMIIILPLFIHILMGGGRSDTAVILMGFKPLLYLIFPLIHFTFNGISALSYNGPFDIHESMLYASLFIIFLIINHITGLIKRSEKIDKRSLILIILLILMSFLKVASIGLFHSIIRYFQFAILVLAFYLIKQWNGKIRKNALVIFMLLMILVSIILLIRGFQIIPVLITLSTSFVFFVILSISMRNSRILIILPIIIFIELWIFNSAALNWIPINKAMNVKYDYLENKRIITFVPIEYEFYKDYILENGDTNDLELAKRFSSYGNRGIYYNAISYNIYNTLMPNEYANVFNDKGLYTGAFTNIMYILNPEYGYDYIFIPDIPFIVKVDEEFSVKYRCKNDTIKIYFSGDIEFSNITYECDPEEDYLINIKNLKCLKMTDIEEIKAKGNGIIYMIKNEKGIVTFINIFEMNGFIKESDELFSIMKTPNRISSIKTLKYNYGKTKILKGHIPIDFLFGFIISVLSLIISIIYIRKEKK